MSAEKNDKKNIAMLAAQAEGAATVASGGSMLPIVIAGGCLIVTLFFLLVGGAVAIGISALGGGKTPAPEGDGSGAPIPNSVKELTVEGKKIILPATEGKVGHEGATSGLGLGSHCNSTEEKWYINMRWPAHEWKWNGLNRRYDDTLSLYGGVRVIVHNPKTKKSVVAVICESGPAPWTGSSWYSDQPASCKGSVGAAYDCATNNPPSYWTGYRRFDPPEADGRVAGLATAPFNAIGANNNSVLQYGFAEDQSLAPGLIQ